MKTLDKYDENNLPSMAWNIQTGVIDHFISGIPVDEYPNWVGYPEFRIGDTLYTHDAITTISSFGVEKIVIMDNGYAYIGHTDKGEYRERTEEKCFYQFGDAFVYSMQQITKQKEVK